MREPLSAALPSPPRGTGGSKPQGSRGEEVDGEGGLVESGRSLGRRTGRGSTASRFPRLPVPKEECDPNLGPKQDDDG